MIVVIGLLALIAATVVTRASVAANSDSTNPLSDNFVISRPRRGTTALRARRDRLDTASVVGHRRHAPGVTADHHDAWRYPGHHHPRQRQRHCADGAYLTVARRGARRHETDRRDRKRQYVTPYRSGLQGENPGKKERR
jgi:hypothetical protein